MLSWAVFSAWRLHGIYTAAALLSTKTPILGELLATASGRRWFVPVTILQKHRMYVNVFDPGIAWQLISRGIREDAHVSQIQGALKPGDCGIELGANIGFFTLVEAPAIGPEGRIWCIEPVSSNLDLLRRNISSNPQHVRTQVFQYLVGDQDGMANIQLATASNSHTISRQQPSRGSEAVPMVTLDTFMRANGIGPEHVNFIRMDIEGYEVMALKGMGLLMESRRPLKFFIELHPQAYGEWGWTLGRFLEELERFGFRIRQIAKERERDEGGKETTIILDNPSAKAVVAAVERWKPGGVQAFLERV